MRYLLLTILAFLLVAGAFVVTRTDDSKASPPPATTAPCIQPLRNGPAVACID